MSKIELKMCIAFEEPPKESVPTNHQFIKRNLLEGGKKGLEFRSKLFEWVKCTNYIF